MQRSALLGLLRSRRKVLEADHDSQQHHHRRSPSPSSPGSPTGGSGGNRHTLSRGSSRSRSPSPERIAAELESQGIRLPTKEKRRLEAERRHKVCLIENLLGVIIAWCQMRWARGANSSSVEACAVAD